MKAKFAFIDPGMIMGVVVALIILGVGVFATFVTLQQINANSPKVDAHGYEVHNATDNLTGTANSVFNIIGIVLIIGAIMAIVGLVYQYVR